MSIAYSRFLVGDVTWYSFLIVLGIFIAYRIGLQEERRLGLPRDTMTDVTLVAVPCGIVGARLYFVAMEWRQFALDPLRILRVWEGGVAIYGAVIGGALGVALYCRKKKLSLGQVVDIIAPGLLLAQAMGRWGNYFNMEAYGPQLMMPSLQWFPLAVQVPLASGGYAWHAATFFYEFLWNLLAFCALWLLRKRQKQPGNVFCWYLLLYGSGRFIIEQLRTDSLWLLGFRVSQWLSLLLCLVSGLILLHRAGKAKPGALALACLGFVVAAARWFCPTFWVYGVLLLLLLLAISLCMLWENRAIAGPSFRLWILPLWLMDLASFYIDQENYFALSGPMLLVIISVTLPCYALWLTQWLARMERGPAEAEGAAEGDASAPAPEEAPAPTETPAPPPEEEPAPPPEEEPMAEAPPSAETPPPPPTQKPTDPPKEDSHAHRNTEE